jgi:hypothetical protein
LLHLVSEGDNSKIGFQQIAEKKFLENQGVDPFLRLERYPMTLYSVVSTGGIIAMGVEPGIVFGP